MQIIQNVLATEIEFPNVVMTLGSFDGVHRGHQFILNEIIQEAKSIGGTSALLTIDPHPREFFAPDNAPNLLTSLDKKLSLLEATGIEAV